MGQHAILSASESHRWTECPGSVEKCAGLPRSSSAAASLGTGVHALAEKFVMTRKKSCKSMLGKTLKYDDGGEEKTLTVDQEMVDAVDVFITLIRELQKGRKGAETKAEHQINLEFVRSGMFGTTDAVVSDAKEIHVIDFKYGFTPVWLYDAENFTADEFGNIMAPTFEAFMETKPNSQLMFYGAGALHEEAWLQEHVILYVVQPRCFDVPDVQRLRVPAEVMDRWANEWLKDRANAASRMGAELIPGDWCTWCPARAECPAVANHVAQLAVVDFREDPANAAKLEGDPENPVETARITGLPSIPEDPNRLSKILKWSPIIDAWLRAANERALEMFHQGNPVPGFKLVRKRANRKWGELVEDGAFLELSEEETVKRLKDVAEESGVTLLDEDLYEPVKLKSPAAVERLGKTLKSVVAQVAVKPMGDVTLADIRDPRDEVVLHPGDDFKEEEDFL